MFSFYKYLILLIIPLGASSAAYTQTIFYQDVFQGGITGAGFSFCLGAGSGTFPVYIEPGSTIKKAYLFSYRVYYSNQQCQYNCTFNGNSLQFSDSNRVTSVLNNQPGISYFFVNAIDVSNLVAPGTTTYSIDMPVSPCIYYNSVFLVILYENPLLGINNVALLLNNNDNGPTNLYNVQNLNPVNTSSPVGYSIYSDRIDGLLDTTEIDVNGWSLGLIGGNDNIDSPWGCGVKGHFYYQDSLLFGLDDDTPDSLVGGSDGLADIRNYIPNNSTTFPFSTINHNPFGTIPYTNFFLTFHLAYTTPCDTFTAGVGYADTLICFGDSVQFFAYGGIKYKWNPTFGLSCDTCSNPFAKPDSSVLYTCTIYNTDSCSKVLPVKINVRSPISFNVNIVPTTCGLQDGSITINNVLNAQTPLSYVINGLPQPTNTFAGLDTGTYILSVTDSNGCSSATVSAIMYDTNYVTANFMVSPLTGVTPLDVNFNYTGNAATNFIWTFGTGDSSIINNPSYTYNNPGSFVITLVTWANDSTCSDTTTTLMLVDPNLVVPQLITPNNDGKNDEWFIGGLSLYPQAGVTIFNRWGNQVYASEPYQNDWRGQCTEPICVGNGILPAGTYFYYVYLYGKDNTNTQDIKSGYLELQP